MYYCSNLCTRRVYKNRRIKNAFKSLQKLLIITNWSSTLYVYFLTIHFLIGCQIFEEICAQINNLTKPLTYFRGNSRKTSSTDTATSFIRSHISDKVTIYKKNIKKNKTIRMLLKVFFNLELIINTPTCPVTQLSLTFCHILFAILRLIDITKNIFKQTKNLILGHSVEHFSFQLLQAS